MKLHTLLLGALVAAGALFSPTAVRAADIDVYVDLAPPAPRYEYVPTPRRGYVWVNGYWDWRGHRHVWVPGRYIRARPGYVYVAPRWDRSGRRWGFRPGYWASRGYRDRPYRDYSYRDDERRRYRRYDRDDRYDRYDRDDRRYDRYDD